VTHTPETRNNVLGEILAHKYLEIAQRKRAEPLKNLQARIPDLAQTRGFHQAIARRIATGHSAVIAEIKKASPSKGVIREVFDPVAIARSYCSGGATCISVLTDERFFQGRDADLKAVSQTVNLPVLRKDFILDPYQIYEARRQGADAILLIAAALEDVQLAELYQLAGDLKLDVLVEVHNAEELSRALALKPNLLGINNRNLINFETRIDTTLGLLSEIPDDLTVVSESGIHTQSDVSRLRDAGVNTFLVGEAFMRAEDPGTALKSLFDSGASRDTSVNY